jgi:hypothetical protein
MKSIVSVFFIALLCAAAWAQTTTQITGTVHDQSGAVLPGVEVTATQTETGIRRTAVTNETGAYVTSRSDRINSRRHCRDSGRTFKRALCWK